MSARAARRAATERIVNRRNKQWVSLMGTAPRRPGRAKDRSHLDCGKTGCRVCARESRRPEGAR